MPKNSRLASWLQDAHSIEKIQSGILERLADGLAAHRELAAGLQSHILQSKEHLNKVKLGLEQLKIQPRPGSLLSRATAGLFKALGDVADGADPLRGLLLLHAIEHLEHATYRALAEAAGTLGYEEIATDSEEIADQELDMADWTEIQLLELVRSSTDRLQPAY